MKTYIKYISAAFLCALMTGCVERTWTIKSEPSGALVYVSGVEKGRTPLTIDFTYYGTYEVILRKDGYETLKDDVELNAPWYQTPGIDFFAEISPEKFEDRRQTLHVLRKKRPPTAEEIEALKKRAEQRRKEARETGSETSGNIQNPQDDFLPPDRRFDNEEGRKRIVMPSSRNR